MQCCRQTDVYWHPDKRIWNSRVDVERYLLTLHLITSQPTLLPPSPLPQTHPCSVSLLIHASSSQNVIIAGLQITKGIRVRVRLMGEALMYSYLWVGACMWAGCLSALYCLWDISQEIQEKPSWKAPLVTCLPKYFLLFPINWSAGCALSWCASMFPSDGPSHSLIPKPCLENKNEQGIAVSL